MLARETPKDLIEVPRKKNYFLRWMLLIGGSILGLIIAGVVFVGVWSVYALHRFEVLNRHVRSAYSVLNASFPFTPPRSNSSLPPERAEAYLRVRGSLMRSAPPSVERWADEVLENPSIKGIRLLRVMHDSYGFLNSASHAHEKALQSEAMSLKEYLWIHGLVMRDILAREASEPDRGNAEVFKHLLLRLQKLGQADKGIKDRFDAEDYVAELEERYRGYGPVDRSVIEQFQVSGTLGELIDLLAANQTFTDRLFSDQNVIAENSQKGAPST